MNKPFIYALAITLSFSTGKAEAQRKAAPKRLAGPTHSSEHHLQTSPDVRRNSALKRPKPFQTPQMQTPQVPYVLAPSATGSAPSAGSRSKFQSNLKSVAPPQGTATGGLSEKQLSGKLLPPHGVHLRVLNDKALYTYHEVKKAGPCKIRKELLREYTCEELSRMEQTRDANGQSAQTKD